jgi:ParB family chromosome partitioning protein
MNIAEKKRPALGRGMAALLPNAPSPVSVAAAHGRAVLSLPIEAVERSGTQPRKRFDEQRLEELAASIREVGVVEPILVRRVGGRYRLVAGERRWRAAQRAGLKEIPAIQRDVSDLEAFEIALVENLQRADLNAIEEAEAYEVLVREHGLTQEEVAEKVGKDRSTVANALRLLRLPAEVRELVGAGKLEMGHARALLGLEEAQAIRRAALRAAREGLSVRATEALVREMLGHAGRKPGAPAETPATRDLAQRLQRRLGARCRVVSRTAAAGRIEIDYTSLEELDGILAKMGV